VILDRDLRTVPPETIRDAGFVGGRIVHERAPAEP
jgi:predicted amidohydrolase YtcJ